MHIFKKKQKTKTKHNKTQPTDPNILEHVSESTGIFFFFA
jgi:hypothetical protein